MHSFVEKYGSILSTVIVRAFVIAKRNNRQLTDMESQIMNRASNAIIPNLVGTIGLNSIEFEVLVFYAAMLNPEEQLGFLNAAAEIISSTRPQEYLTEYDQVFLDFVAQLLEAISNAQQANQGELIPPVPFATESMQQAPFNDALPAQSQSFIQTVSVDMSMISESSITSCHTLYSAILSTNTLMPDHTVGTNFHDQTTSLSEATQTTNSGTLQAPGGFYSDLLGDVSETEAPDYVSQEPTTDSLDWDFPDSESDWEADLQALVQSINEINMG
ncbi:hypothetical protein ACHAPU_009396 [Fusarium lateritium]